MYKSKQFEFYLDKMLFPVAPGELTVKIKDKNEIIDLASGSEFVIAQKPGLTKISFTALLPSEEYPWADYKGSFVEPSYFLKKLEDIKVSGKAVDFAVIRNYGGNDNNTFMRVKLGEYTIKEDAQKQLNDITVDIELVQDSPTKSHEVKLAKNGKATLEKTRQEGEGKKKLPCTHPVKEGETLSEISRRYYGKSTYWRKLARDNGLEKRPHSLKGVKTLKIGVI